MDEAPLIMLFLKSLTRVEVLHWAPDAAAPELLFDCTVQVLTADLSVCARAQMHAAAGQRDVQHASVLSSLKACIAASMRHAKQVEPRAGWLWAQSGHNLKPLPRVAT